MTFTEQLRAMLLCLTDGPLGAVEVEWHPASSPHPDDEPTSSYLMLQEYGTYVPRIKVEHPDGQTALYELLGTDEKQVKEMQESSGGTPKYIIKRTEDAQLSLAKVM